jgi:hypothetical protein
MHAKKRCVASTPQLPHPSAQSQQVWDYGRPAVKTTDADLAGAQTLLTQKLRRIPFGILAALRPIGHQLEDIRHSAELGKRTGLHLPHQVRAMHLHSGFSDADMVGNLFV